ncbi:MAG: glycosyltransferase family 4 protein [Candidatus Methylumidiphilus sp.]
MRTQAGSEPISILLDLKPAFDGYAGIPQETRLLFRGLRTMAGCDVEGLIQHGGRTLRTAISSAGRPLPTAKRINRLSRVVVSLYEAPCRGFLGKLGGGLESYFALLMMRLRIMSGLALTPGVFESDLFDDFVWRTLFSKTLKPEDMKAVTTARFRILRPPKKLLHQIGLAGLKFSSTPRYVKIDTRGFDVFLAQTPFPARVSKGTRMVVRYHDAVPVLMPHTIKDPAFHQASHFYALQANVRSGAWFSCVSDATRADLLKIFPQAEPRTSVIHNIVSNEYFEEDLPKNLIFQIIRTRLGKIEGLHTDLSILDAYQSVRGETSGSRVEYGDDTASFDYLLMVSTIEPRKNHLLLIEAWERLKYTSTPDLKLVVIGSVGWGHQSILNAFRPWAERGELFYLNNVPSCELRLFYKHAAATVCPSFAEGFGYTGVEAMRSGGVVVSSDIPVHREIYGDGSEYFNPYSTEDAAAAIGRVIVAGNATVREQLRKNARGVSDRYTPRIILPQWDAFFRTLKQS